MHVCSTCRYFFPSPAWRVSSPAKQAFAPIQPLAPLPPLQPLQIDAVYTWVDGADPEHAARRSIYMPKNSAGYSSGNHLYRDNQELRYSLRSLAAYAPWIRRVHIVTDQQKPPWLRTEHPDIQLVDHAQIIPAQFLPTFNSHVIEAFLHRIPDLAEHFIYFNDDFFLTAQTAPEDFFTAGGLPYLFIDWRASRRQGYEKTETPHAWSYFNTRAELERQGIIPTPEFITAHIPYPQTRSNAQSVFNFFEKSIMNFACNKFRTTREMAFYCHAASLWCFAMKRAVPCDAPYWYVNTKRWDRRRIYAALLAQKHSAQAALFLCLNDVSPGKRTIFWRRSLKNFLQKYYPLPSPFEIEME